eukprot:156475_1
MKGETQCNSLLFLIAISVPIAVIDGWQCQLYLHTLQNGGGTTYGPFDVGQSVNYAWRNNIWSATLHAAGYHCYAELNQRTCYSTVTTLHTSPHDVTFVNDFTGDDYDTECVRIWAVATPNPTLMPSDASLPPTSAPTSSCLDYNNETSSDGNNEIRQFDDRILQIDNYFINVTFVSVNSSRDNYQHKLIECVGSYCFIQCNQNAECLETNIEINIQNKTALLLCDGDYSCPGASVKTQSGFMANITVVCKGKYSCINMKIQLAHISSFNLYCLQYQSCFDVNVSIDSNNNDTMYNDGIITCVSLHSCDNLVITTNSNQTQLIMYQYSEDVTLNNGAGYFYDYDN